jgi:uncharacterized protein YbjT (DUF2867 family)
MYVIFGASGRVGAATAAALRAAGEQVRAVVRDARAAAPLARIGCEVAVADLDDRAAVQRALDGARGVQMLMPIPQAAADPAPIMRRIIGNAVSALRAAPPQVVLALSDYGAELPAGTGITAFFHELEARLRDVASHSIFLRSAEHMENWLRVVPAALATGKLPSFHHPLGKRFPSVAARDVGIAAADLLREAAPLTQRIVSIEGPRRIDAHDVARALAATLDRPIEAIAAPREAWDKALARAGLGQAHARLIIELFDAHNAGAIDVEADRSERRYGTTDIAACLAARIGPVAGQANDA